MDTERIMTITTEEGDTLQVLGSREGLTRRERQALGWFLGTYPVEPALEQERKQAFSLSWLTPEVRVMMRSSLIEAGLRGTHAVGFITNMNDQSKNVFVLVSDAGFVSTMRPR